MKLNDIITLAKHGYKPSDIKELIELSKDEPKDEPGNEPEDEPGNEPEDEPGDEPEDEPEGRPRGEKQKEIDKLKEQIKKLQEENARKDNSDNDDLKSDDEKLVDLFRDFIE